MKTKQTKRVRVLAAILAFAMIHISLLTIILPPVVSYAEEVAAEAEYEAKKAAYRKQIKAKAGYSASGYVKGMVCTVYEVKGSWGRTPSGWICLDYCKKK